ncbi:unnamed protein product [Paramecium primaurelia]|uniref:Aurora kinase n=1 Tax=Paramecium primaurelia TaxID=5886 RepID=A0A8S1JM44_PARPR|nr:unnamed protein product [Paramecium primaurelia]
MTNLDQIGFILSNDKDWQNLVEKCQSIDSNIKNMQTRLTFTIGQMNKEIGNRHIIPAYQVEEEQNKEESPLPQQGESPRKKPVNLVKQAQVLAPVYSTISERFQICKFLGKGKFSDVYQAQDKQSKIIVALKVIPKATIQKYGMEKQLANEIKIQGYLDHPNILKLFGYFQEWSKVVLILEYATDGELFKLLKKQPKKRFSEQTVSGYIRQIIEGIGYMHSKNIIHRDIKPENILITHSLLKIADMGLSTYNPTNQVRQSFCGTVDYMSPEIAAGRDYDHTVDLWAIGILAFELCTGETPFYEKKKEDTMNKIIYSGFEFPNFISEECKNFVRALVQKDPKKRLSIFQIMQHSWIQKYEKESTIFNRDLLNSMVKLLK